MIILRNQQAAFIAIPKTGSDSVTKFLINNVTGAHNAGGGKHWPVWMHQGTYRYKFAFVREPVAFYRSFYSFIQTYYIKPHGHYPVFEVNKWHPMRRWEKYNWDTFESFIESLYSDDPSYYTRMIEWFVGPENSHMLNFVGKQERLSAGLERVLTDLNLAHLMDKVKKMPRINTSPSKFRVDNSIISLIQEQESAVYRRFNYNKQ